MGLIRKAMDTVVRSQSTAAGGSVGLGGTSGQWRQISVNANNPSTREFNLGLSLKF